MSVQQIYNVLRCPKTPFGVCEMAGSFRNRKDAVKCKQEQEVKIDTERFVILIHPIEYTMSGEIRTANS